MKDLLRLIGLSVVVLAMASQVINDESAAAKATQLIGKGDSGSTRQKRDAEDDLPYQSIDEMIAASYESAEEFDRLADISGNTIRQELDMLLSKEQAIDLGVIKDDKSRKRRKAIRGSTYRWKNRVIPYAMNNGAFSTSDRAVIQTAIAEWEKYSCLNFRPARSGDSNKIYFDNGQGCYSYVGMQRSGSQKIGLARGCRYKGVVVHEIGHAVGFHHEQNRPDRDEYVTVVRSNIPSNLYYNFQKYSTRAVDTMGVPYDYSSVMHYGGRAFSTNGQYTIRTRDPKDQKKLGNRKGLSFNDVMLANKMYACSSHCDQGIRCPRGGFLGKDCKCWCPGYPVTQCTSTGTIATTTESPGGRGTTPKASCKDGNQYCAAWARAGYCGRNTYVKTYCKKSCGFCSGDSKKVPTCKDLNTHCAHWGQLQYCSGNFEVFMSENCAKTCNLCDSAKGDPNGNDASVVNTSLLVVFSYSVLAVYKELF